ncbi:MULTISPECIES: hypothetical protein [Streptomyces]|uniref:Uncharacterized protein n=1 Tax=Streptomyces ramulosus TaxID=47762 RepID=A0ABW1FPK8_9ACTN
MSGAGDVRVLPWETPDGKTCLLIGDGKGLVSRVADRVEEVQLGMAAELLGHADVLLDDRRVTGVELRFLATRLAEALRCACRIAEGRVRESPAPGEGAARGGAARADD